MVLLSAFETAVLKAPQGTYLYEMIEAEGGPDDGDITYVINGSTLTWSYDDNMDRLYVETPEGDWTHIEFNRAGEVMFYF